MKDYKRLTIRGGDLGFYGNVCNKCSNKDRPDIRKQLKEGKKSYEIEGYEYTEYTSEELSDIYKRLGELEDKIEQGRLVELPCKVGDTVYMPWEYDGVSGVAELTVIDIFLDLNIGSSSIQTNLESDVAEYMRRYRYGLFEFNEVGKKIFLNKEEAESRLQELKGEQK